MKVAGEGTAWGGLEAARACELRSSALVYQSPTHAAQIVPHTILRHTAARWIEYLWILFKHEAGIIRQ